jgi:hypothetical protein
MNIPTAEEFATEYDGFRLPRGISYTTDIGELMIEFAKMHIEEFKKAVIENVDFTAESYNSMQVGSIMQVDVNSIINAYPISNIK